MYGYPPNFKMSFYTMSDHYFKAAKEAGCIGLHTGMTGFHACASENDCFKNGKPKKGKPKTGKPKKAKKAKTVIVVDEDEVVPIIEPRRSLRNRGKGIQGGCGSCSSPWIAHVKHYQDKHGCSYKIALSEASKTYHR
jgi:hypothetical protein